MPRKAARGLGDAVKDPSAFVSKGPGQERGKAKASNGDKVMMNTRIPPKLMKHMKIHCATNDLTIQTFVREALEDRLKK